MNTDFIARVAADPTPMVRYNQVSHPSKPLVKTARMVDGQLAKESGGRIPGGCTVTTHTCSLAEYVVGVHGGGVSQYALPSNAVIGDGVPLGPKQSVPEGGVDRSAETFKFVQGPAALTFDHDPSPYATNNLNSPGDVQGVLVKCFPNVFGGAAYVGYYSSSSYLKRPDGTQYSGARGHHTVFAVADASDVRRFSEALFKQLWRHRYGYIFITRSGVMIPRTIFDAKVHEPQQPLFAGGMNCLDGILQERPAPEIVSGDYVKTGALSSLSPGENHEYEKLVAAAKATRQDEADRVRREYRKTEMAVLVGRGVPEERARRTIEARLGDSLVGDDPLQFAEHGTVTVAEVLAEPQKYNECTLCDPVEPEYGTDATAIFYANAANNKPIVFSHAHGGRSFFLRHDERSIEARLLKTPAAEVGDLWKRLIVHAQLDEDALERVLVLVKKITGTGLVALRKAAKAAFAAQLPATSDAAGQDPALRLANRVLEALYEGGRTLLQLDSGAFYHYKGTHWALVSEKSISSEIQRIAAGSWNDVKCIYTGAGKSVPPLPAIVASVLDVLGNQVLKTGDPLRFLARSPNVINMINGELWLRDEGPVLQPHSPDSYLTSCSTITYDLKAEAPTFEAALRGMLSFSGGMPMLDQDEMVRHVTELLGYICQSGRFLKMFMVIVGPGDNGKTRLSKLIEFVIGLDAISFDKLSGMNEEGSRFASSRLVGKLVAIDDDVDHEYLLPDGLLKKIAEEKPMTAERKFQSEFTFRAQVVVILLSNSWPRLRDLSRGLRTRAQVLYLPRSFKRPDECLQDDPDRQRPELWEKVYGEEMPGVVNLLVRGFYRIKERGGLLPPKSARDALDTWFANANVVSRFLADACEKVSPEKSGPTMTSLYAAFQSWAEKNHVQGVHRPQLKSMRERLEALGYKVIHTNAGSCVFGLRLKPEDWVEEMPIGSGADAPEMPMVVGRAREQPEELCDLV